MSDDRVLHGPKGELFRFLRTTEETRGALLEFEATPPAGHNGPPPHLHLRETESFHVCSGALHVRLGKQWRELGPGESAAVPPSTPHTFANRSDSESVFVVRLEPPNNFEKILRLQLTSKVPPLLEVAKLNSGDDATFMLAGLPVGPQRMVWNGLAGIARLLRR